MATMVADDRIRLEESTFVGYESQFDRAVESIRMDRSLQLSNLQKLKLYGLFKQATKGDCQTSQPGRWIVCWSTLSKFKVEWHVFKGWWVCRSVPCVGKSMIRILNREAMGFSALL